MKASFLGIELANIHYDENMSISARSGITITKLTPMIRFVKYRQKTRQNTGVETILMKKKYTDFGPYPYLPS